LRAKNACVIALVHDIAFIDELEDAMKVTEVVTYLVLVPLKEDIPSLLDNNRLARSVVLGISL